MTIRVNRAIRTGITKLTQERVTEWEGVAGNGAGTIYVPGTNEQLMYVRPVGSNIPVKVRSGSAQVTEGTRVWVGKDFGNQRRTRRVLGATVGGTGSGGSGSSGTVPLVEDFFLTGKTPLWIDQAQIVNLLATPSVLTVTVKQGWVIIAGKAVWVEKQTIDMSGHVPGSGALYALIRADSDGVLSVQEGTPVTDFVDLTKDDIPAVEVGYVELWAVRLYAGQTAISWTTTAPDLADLRFAPRDQMAVGEEDGSPLGYFKEIKFPNNSLTNNGDGTVSVDLSAAAGDSTFTGPYASRPAPSNSGDLHFANDAPVLGRATGAIWENWYPSFPMTSPVDGDFTWINQDGATVSVANGGIVLYDPAKNSHSVSIRKKAAPSTPYTITACILPNRVGPVSANIQCAMGIGWRQSSDGKLVLLYDGFYNSALTLSVLKWTNETTFSASYGSYTVNFVGLKWLRITDNGANRICSFSLDGLNFIPIHTVGRTDFMTGDEILFFSNAYDTSALYPQYLNLLSWKES